jgi:hypothetical protein
MIKPEFLTYQPPTVKPEPVTVEGEYGTENPQIPDGYEVVGFRPPLEGDLYLPLCDFAVETWDSSYCFYPVLILQKKPKPVQHVYEECSFGEADISHESTLSGLKPYKLGIWPGETKLGYYFERPHASGFIWLKKVQNKA